MPIPSDLLQSLRNAKSIVALTGAGVSAESGIPTFRDALTGHWARFNPADLATPEAFARDPQLVSRWYDQRRCDVAKCRPNPGHFALATLQKRRTATGKRFTLVTQNVDHLHASAARAPDWQITYTGRSPAASLTAAASIPSNGMNRAPTACTRAYSPAVRTSISSIASAFIRRAHSAGAARLIVIRTSLDR